VIRVLSFAYKDTVEQDVFFTVGTIVFLSLHDDSSHPSAGSASGMCPENEETADHVAGGGSWEWRQDCY
jgi:hypothetical protein